MPEPLVEVTRGDLVESVHAAISWWQKRLQPYHRIPLYNHRKEIVGEVRARFHLTG